MGALKRLSLSAGLLLLAAACYVGESAALAVPRSDPPPLRYFPETGHYVGGPFLDFFAGRGGEAVFGYPITGPLTQDGRTVQYFQQARLELHPESPRLYRVEPGLLNELLGRRTPPLPAAETPPSGTAQQRYYSQTGHTASFDFLRFFDAHGGLDTFGYPISEPFVEGGTVVQDFQRARFIWNPQYPAGERVRLAPLGETYFQARGGSPALLAPARFSPPPDDPALSSSLRVKISLAQPVVGSERAQIIYVRVEDDEGHGQSGVRGEVTARFPGGEYTGPLPPTDGAGFTHALLPIGAEAKPGALVQVDVFMHGEGRSGLSRTAFLLR